MGKTYERVLEDIKAVRIYSTHCHHRNDEFFCGMSLGKLLHNSYVCFGQRPSLETSEERTLFLEQNRYNTYYLWLERSIMELYSLPERICAENWDEVSQKIADAYELDADRHLSILKEKCRYDRVVQDTFWDTGSDLGHPELFMPAYRISPFVYGLDEIPRDHDGNLLYEKGAEDRRPADLDEFIARMEERITEKVRNGCVALKSALAYARDLNFLPQDRDHIARLYKTDRKLITDADRRAFSDYVVYEVCKIAAKLDVPFQHHTGLGAIERTNAMQLRELIVRNPDTKFVLFHGSYPWLDDIYALMHNLRNVYADLCWLPLISTSAAERMILELLEVGQPHRIHWGCDTWTSEESYGAVLAVEHSLAYVLASQIDRGFYTFNDASFIANAILRENTRRLYKIQCTGKEI